MAHTVERLPNEPIIVATPREPLDLANELVAMFGEIDALIQPGETKIVVISDLRDMKLDFEVFARVFSMMGRKIPGSRSDPRVNWFVVGNPLLLRLHGSLSRLLPNDIPGRIHSTLEDALDSGRAFLRGG